MEKKETISVQELKDALLDLADNQIAVKCHRYFKTEKGGYAEHDVFIGVKVPETRKLAKSFYKQISLSEISILLQDAIHECRQLALFILVYQFEASKDLQARKNIVDFYLAHAAYINNWDLVDASTHKIVGAYVHDVQDFNLLIQLSQNDNMWVKRIAVVALWSLWKHGYVTEGLVIVHQNLFHKHDLMHKANGWMLRELGKYNEAAMLDFLKEHYAKLPRTTLRYAIEKIEENRRKKILEGQF